MLECQVRKERRVGYEKTGKERNSRGVQTTARWGSENCGF